MASQGLLCAESEERRWALRARAVDSSKAAHTRGLVHVQSIMAKHMSTGCPPPSVQEGFLALYAYSQRSGGARAGAVDVPSSLVGSSATSSPPPSSWA